MGDIKHRFKLGMFLARPKKDPLTRAFLHGSLMDKAYDFDIPEDISEIPDHERVKPKPSEFGGNHLKTTHRLLANRAAEPQQKTHDFGFTPSLIEASSNS